MTTSILWENDRDEKIEDFLDFFVKKAHSYSVWF